MLYGGDAEAHAAEAHHFAEAQTVLGAEKLVHYSLLAGERALSGFAFEEALAHFERGLMSRDVPLTGSQPAPDEGVAALLFGLGQAQAATLPLYQIPQAVASLIRAFDYYAQTGEVERAVSVAEHSLPTMAGHYTGVGQLIARALKLVPPSSLQAGRLLSRYGNVLALQEGDFQGGQEALGQALDIARRENDPLLEFRTLVSVAEVELYHTRWRECLQAIELAPRLDDPRAEMLAQFFATLPLLIMGDPDTASRHLAACLAPAERLGHHFFLARALSFNEFLSLTTGQLRAARKFSDRGLTVSPREPRLLVGRVILEYEEGDFD